MRRPGARLLGGSALLLAAIAIFLSAWLFTRLKDQQDATDQSRVNVTYRICEEQNDRHDNTVAELDERLGKITDPAQKVRARASRAFTVALINALAPHQDCLKTVRRRYGERVNPTDPPPPPP